MTAFRAIAAAGVLALTGAARSQNVVQWTDPSGDAVVRRTDTGNNGPLNPSGVLPDLVRVTLCGWQPINAAADPYAGSCIAPAGAHLFRLQVVFKGLVNPPGTLGIGGQGFDPFRFGPSPVLGFLELDVDNDRDTGGELDPGARLRYLANVARFGRRPTGSIGERVAVSAKDYDPNFATSPQYERSGADFALVLCGCWNITIVSEGGNGNGQFDPGETWIVRGRFLQRSGGYQCASTAFGGSAPGLYDPWANLRFSHDPGTGETTLTMVAALTMTGASQLTGQPQQPINYSVFDHTSIVEGLQDVIDHANNLTGPCFTLAERWRGRDPFNFLKVDDWRVRGLFGTSYSSQEDSLYVWTDTGMNETPGDLDSDGIAGPLDRALVQQTILLLDGGPDDGDGVVNGSVQIVNFGINFNLHDVNGDGLINATDLGFYGTCRPDCNGDGILNVADVGCFQTRFSQGHPYADFNGDGVVNLADVGAYMSAFGLGCP